MVDDDVDALHSGAHAGSASGDHGYRERHDEWLFVALPRLDGIPVPEDHAQ